MTTKRCTGCHSDLPTSAFIKDARGYGDGLRNKCRSCRRLQHKLWVDRTGYRVPTEYMTRWRGDPKNFRRAKDKAKEYRSRNRDAEKERLRRWRQQNRAYLTAKQAEREAALLRATPAWANMAYIELWYEISSLEQSRTGRKCHVDHIVPLKSPLVCGLHVEHNLQVLFFEDNVAKSNRHWPGAPASPNTPPN